MFGAARTDIGWTGTDYTGLSNWLTDSYPTLRQISDPYNNASLVYDIHRKSL